jgi:hypothetical protein
VSAKVTLLDSIRRSHMAAAVGKLTGADARAYETRLERDLAEARRQGWAASAAKAQAHAERAAKRHVLESTFRW